MSWAESMDVLRGTREGGPFQRRERGKETLGHRSPSCGVQDREEGYWPQMLAVGLGFPRWETEASIEAGHTPFWAKAPNGFPCPSGTSSVLTRESRDFLGVLKTLGPPLREGTGVDSVPHRGSARLGAPAVFGHFVLFLTLPRLEVRGKGEGNPASSATHRLQPSSLAWPGA